MDDSKVFMFPDSAKSGIDPNLLAALSSGGGFGNGGNWMWMMFMWILFPWIFNGNGFNGFGNGGGLVNQINNDAGRDLLLQAINGRADALNQLATMLNTSVSSVSNAVNQVQSAVQTVGSQVGLTGAQVINSIQAGNASLSQQLCQCCCENRLAVANQTSALQSQMASNHAAATLQSAQQAAADQLAMSQQTNQLGSQADRNTQSVINAISGQTTMITKQFCDLKERELQNKIDSLTADNALLRSNLNNTVQTQQFAAMLAPINNELAAIRSHQPQTITLPYSQYAVVPAWAANVGSDFVASYWANRLSTATTPSTTTRTTNS